jgi:RNA polymerase-interacting CarD/CdnL/TRCF family regulator
MDTRVAFHIGDKIVYRLYGMGRVTALCLLTLDHQSQGYYRLVLEGKPQGEVLVPVASAQALGLRHVLLASQVPQVLRQVQQATTQPARRGQALKHYAWCKARLRQGGVLGLAEVWRFLHELTAIEPITAPQLKQLRDYVGTQLPAELAAALPCTSTVAQHLLTTALASERPVVLPSPADG